MSFVFTNVTFEKNVLLPKHRFFVTTKFETAEQAIAHFSGRVPFIESNSDLPMLILSSDEDISQMINDDPMVKFFTRNFQA